MAAGLSGQPDGTSGLLSGPWRLLLLGDGSPTRHLQSLTGLEVEVEVIAMEADTDACHEAPAEVAELDQPLLRRQEAARHLQERNQPIWRSLTAKRAELYREVDGLALVEAPALEEGFGRPGPYWSRHYRFFRGGKELTVIREVFSPAVEQWLGPAQHTAS